MNSRAINVVVNEMLLFLLSMDCSAVHEVFIVITVVADVCIVVSSVEVRWRQAASSSSERVPRWKLDESPRSCQSPPNR